jgi:ferric-dicitrate binding protein FerR (iron transport regulator)
MRQLCCCCQKSVHGNMLLCHECAKRWGVEDDSGGLKPRSEWPAWLAQLDNCERAWRRSERAFERHCVECLDMDEIALSELRGSAE